MKKLLYVLPVIALLAAGCSGTSKTGNINTTTPDALNNGASETAQTQKIKPSTVDAAFEGFDNYAGEYSATTPASEATDATASTQSVLGESIPSNTVNQ